MDLLSGVTILDHVNVVKDNDLFVALIAFLALLSLSFLVRGLSVYNRDCLKIGSVLFGGAVFAALVMWTCPTVTYYEYKVKIDSEVNYIEFVDRFFVLERKGDIFTIVKQEDKINATTRW